MTFYDLIAATTFLERYHINYMDLPTDNHLPIVVDVDGDVILRGENLTNADIKVKFRNVTGNFDCSYNKLTLLDFAPEHVCGNFDCSSNIYLISLENAPKYVDLDFKCNLCQISSLGGLPCYVGRNFECYGNKITSLTKAPIYVGGNFYCSSNKLTNIDDISTKYVGGNFYCHGNKIKNLDALDGIVKGMKVRY